ncbi:MAG: DUF2283 domain-containing protein [Patescibacteria group bacterium]
MKVTYDPKADAMRISFSDDSTSTRTEELGGDFLADYSGNKLISVEILDASKKLPKGNLDMISANLHNFPLA